MKAKKKKVKGKPVGKAPPRKKPAEAAGKHPGGRPSKFTQEMSEQVEKLCRLGATDKELADFFHIQVSTLNNWKQHFPEFMESIKRGKEISDMNVADRLY